MDFGTAKNVEAFSIRNNSLFRKIYFLIKLLFIWYKYYKELRFGQFLYILLNGRGLFYIEDSEFLKKDTNDNLQNKRTRKVIG